MLPVPSQSPPQSVSVDVIPPAEFRPTAILAGVAAGVALLSALAGVVAGETGPGAVATLRLCGVGVAALLAGSAVSLRPASPAVWLLAVLTAALNSKGLPDHWDSGQLLLRVIACVALVAAGLLAMPATYRRVTILTAVAFHFTSLFCATTWPEPTPWIVGQVGQRVFLPYMQFTYLRNAYHFYSPEPGPASCLFALVTYEKEAIDPKTGKPETLNEWVLLPRRDTQTKDPLGQTYYRRLSITENAIRVATDLGNNSEERRHVNERRQEVALGLKPGVKRIQQPPPSYELEFRWYSPPQADVVRYILPSYTRHLAEEYTSPGYKVVNVKMYRAEHRIVTNQFFVTQRLSPYHPTLYRVYFLGDYNGRGELVDPLDPMLYWIIPILPKAGRHDLGNPQPDQYTDLLTEHAGFEFPWSSLRP